MNQYPGTPGSFNISRMIKRHVLRFILPVILLPPAVLAAAMFMPKIYRANTTILVEPPKIPSHYVPSLVQVPIEKRLKTITQQIMSRSRLLTIIKELNLIEKNASPVHTERKIAQMQETIEIEVKGTASFQVAYKGPDPETVMRVTNKLASLFIEENLKVSERIAQTTTNFLGEELAKVQRELEEQETALQNFKEEHMGELPEQLEANLRSLDRLQLQFQAEEQVLRDQKEKKLILQNRILQYEPPKQHTPQKIKTDQRLAKLNQLKGELEALLSRYSDEWPRVKQVKEEIAHLEKQIAQNRGETEGEEPPAKEVKEKPTSPDLILASMEEELKKTKREIKDAQAKHKKTAAELAKYKNRVENTPHIEQELVSLTRNYQMTRNKYQSLLNKKLDAQLSESLETKQKGETFKVLDAAEIPLLPYKPDLKKYLILGVFAGLAIGVGGVWLKENFDHSLKDTQDIQLILDLPVLGIVSNIVTQPDRRRKHLRAFMLFCALVVYFTCLFFLVKNRKQVKQYVYSLHSAVVNSK